MHGEDRFNIKTQLIIGALKLAEFPDHISIDYDLTKNNCSYLFSREFFLIIEQYNVYSCLVFVPLVKHSCSFMNYYVMYRVLTRPLYRFIPLLGSLRSEDDGG